MKTISDKPPLTSSHDSKIPERGDIQAQIEAAIAADREALARDYERKAKEYVSLGDYSTPGGPTPGNLMTNLEMARLCRAVAKTIRNFPRATASTNPPPTGEPKL